MICPNCKYENEEAANYCIECGTKLVKEDINVEEKINEIIEEKKENAKEWYYVKQKESIGPFTYEEMVNMIQNREIGENTYVWKEGMADWTLIRETEFMDGIKNWYYAKDEKTMGPFSQKEMEQMIENHEISGNTYVWQEGMEDWILLKKSGLVSSTYSISAKKNIALQVILTVITGGIYKLFWYYSMAGSINCLARRQNQKEPFEPLLVVVLSIFTCGLYAIYFFWKAGKSVAHLQYEGIRIDDDSTLLAIVAVFASIVSCAILQNSINDILEYEE